MLVLSRKYLESIYIKFKGPEGKEEQLKLQIVDVGNRKVKIGFETDNPEIIILREELLKQAA